MAPRAQSPNRLRVVLAGQLDRPVQELPELSLMELAGRRQHSYDVTLPITHKDRLSKMVRRDLAGSGSLPRRHGPLMNENVIADIMALQIVLQGERDRHGCLLYGGARRWAPAEPPKRQTIIAHVARLGTNPGARKVTMPGDN